MNTFKSDLDQIGVFVATLIVGYAAIFAVVFYQAFNPVEIKPSTCRSAVCVGYNVHYNLNVK